MHEVWKKVFWGQGEWEISLHIPAVVQEWCITDNLRSVFCCDHLFALFLKFRCSLNWLSKHNLCVLFSPVVSLTSLQIILWGHLTLLDCCLRWLHMQAPSCSLSSIGCVFLSILSLQGQLPHHNNWHISMCTGEPRGLLRRTVWGEKGGNHSSASLWMKNDLSCLLLLAPAYVWETARLPRRDFSAVSCLGEGENLFLNVKSFQ